MPSSASTAPALPALPLPPALRAQLEQLQMVTEVGRQCEALKLTLRDSIDQWLQRVPTTLSSEAAIQQALRRYVTVTCQHQPLQPLHLERGGDPAGVSPLRHRYIRYMLSPAVTAVTSRARRRSSSHGRVTVG